MAGLEEVGIPGPDHLREALNNCSEPLAAIEEFQEQNGILLPSLRPALPFLDLHSVSRLGFHQSVMETLRDKLVVRITQLAESDNKHKYKILNDMLTKSFTVIKIKSLRPVALCIMQHLPKIKQEYLTAVMTDKALYNDVAVEVKQQIWEDNQALFGDEVSPLLSKYIEDKEKALFDHETLDQSFFAKPPKARRQEAVVQQLVKMVGKNVKLYDMVLQFLRTLFLRTRNIHYCTLRAEILMALHDLDIHEICTVDPCHKFTWCLDACIRERFVDSKRAKELQVFLDGVRRGQEQVLGDLSMILCDPHAVHTLSMSIMKTMQQMIVAEGIPRQSEDLMLLLRMLGLGLKSWQMIDSQVFKENKLDPTLMTRLLPLMMSLMVDDNLTAMNVRKPDEQLTQLEPIPEYILYRCRDSVLGATLLCYYTIQAARQRDASAVCRVLPVLCQCEVERVYQDTILHLLVTALALMPDSFALPEVCEAVFDHMFLPSLSREAVLRHLLRLIWWVHPKVPQARLTQLMNKLEPNNQHSEAVRSMHFALRSKIETYQPSPVPEPEKLDSPLMSVPAPTPAHI